MAYQPPRQSGLGQIVDSLIILALLFLCLLLPFEMKKKWAAEEAATATPTAQAAPTTEPNWENLGQNKVQAQQWEKLGKKPQDAKALIENKFDFEKDLRSFWLWITIVVIVGYFLLILRLSEREYREVIDEHFGKNS